MLGIGPRWMRDFKPRTIRVSDFTADAVPSADVLLLDSWTIAARGFALPRVCGNPVHLVQHDERLYHGPVDIVTAVYRSPHPKVVISHWLKEIFEKDFGISPPVLVTPVDFTLFYPVSGVRKENRVRILLLQHPYEWKGSEEGLCILEELKRTFPEIEIVMFGVRDKHPGTRCDEYHYDLPQEKLAELYSSCDIYLCPSWYEGLGMPSMEAMACGSTLVTYDNGGSRDYAIDGETAFVAAHRDQKDLFNKLKIAVSNAELRRRIATAGTAKIKSLPHWDEQVGQLENIFASVCK